MSKRLVRVIHAPAYKVYCSTRSHGRLRKQIGTNNNVSESSSSDNSTYYTTTTSIAAQAWKSLEFVKTALAFIVHFFKR